MSSSTAETRQNEVGSVKFEVRRKFERSNFDLRTSGLEEMHMRLRWFVGAVVLLATAGTVAAQQRGGREGAGGGQGAGRAAEAPVPRLKLSSSGFTDGGA